MKFSKPAGSAFILVIFILTIGIGIVPFSMDSNGSPSGPQAGEPDIELIIHQDSIKVNVDPNSNGVATVTGEVTCEMPPYTPNTVFCIVDLRVESGGWPASVPPSLTFSNSISVNNFAITVQVPLGSPVSDSRDVIMSGTWQYSPGNQGGTVNSDTFFVDIQPYSFLEILNTDYNVSITGESSKKITASVTNTGNIKSEIRAGAFTSDEAIEIEFKETDYSISPYQKAEIEFTIKEKKNQNGLYTVTFWVEEKELTNQGRVTQNFQVQAKEDTFSLDDIPFLIPGAIILVLIIFVILGYLFIRRRRNRRIALDEDIELEV